MQRKLTLTSLFLVYSCDLLVISTSLVIIAPMVLGTFTEYSTATQNLIIGFLLAAYPLGQFLFAPLWGELSDHFGRRPVLLCTLIGTAVGVCLTAVGIMQGSLWLLFAARLLGGVMDGNMTVSMAGVADMSPEKTRGRYIAALTALGGISWAVGAQLSSVLSDVSLAAPFWILGGFLVILAVLVLFTIPAVGGTPRPFRLSHAIGNITSLFRNRQAAWPLMILIGQMVGFYIYITFLSAYLIEQFGFDVHMEGWGYTANALAWFVGGLIASLWLLKRYRARRVALWPLLLVPAVLLIFLFIQRSWAVWGVIPLAATGEAIVQASMLTIVSLVAGPAMQGKVFGAFQAGIALASILGPALAGWLAGYTLWLPFLIAVIVMWIAAAFLPLNRARV